MIKLIGLAGASCSGKSTLAERAERELDFELVKLDKFFREAADLPVVAGRPNCEVPGALLFDELYEVLVRLRRGERVPVPTYSKPTMHRTGWRWAEPKPVVLVEGFLLLWDARIRALLDRTVFLEVDESTIRRRRLARQPEADPRYIDEVLLPAYGRYGAPAAALADIVLDGSADPETVWQQFRRAL